MTQRKRQGLPAQVHCHGQSGICPMASKRSRSLSMWLAQLLLAALEMGFQWSNHDYLCSDAPFVFLIWLLFGEGLLFQALSCDSSKYPSKVCNTPCPSLLHMSERGLVSSCSCPHVPLHQSKVGPRFKLIGQGSYSFKPPDCRHFVLRDHNSL